MHAYAVIVFQCKHSNVLILPQTALSRDCTGLEKIFCTYSSCGASGLNFSLVLTPVELVLKSGILKETKHIIQ